MAGNGNFGVAVGVALAAATWGLWWMPMRALAEAGIWGDWVSLAIFGTLTLLFLPFAWVRRARLREAGWLLAAIGLVGGGGFALWNHAVLTGEVVRVTLMFYLAPIWATGLAVVVLRERLHWLRAVSIALGLGGALVVLGFEGGIPMPRSTGEWMALAAGWGFALGATGMRRLGAGGALEKSFVTFAGGAVGSLLLILLTSTGQAPQPAAVLAALPLLIGCILYTLPLTWLQIRGAERLDPGRVAVLLLLELPVGVISAAILTDEPFGWREAFGCILILAAGVAEAMAAMPRPAQLGLGGVKP
jgi:drug/metabolite transporter (DMT)-like permease